MRKIVQGIMKDTSVLEHGRTGICPGGLIPSLPSSGATTGGGSRAQGIWTFSCPFLQLALHIGCILGSNQGLQENVRNEVAEVEDNPTLNPPSSSRLHGPLAS